MGPNEITRDCRKGKEQGNTSKGCSKHKKPGREMKKLDPNPKIGHKGQQSDEINSFE